MKTTKNDEKIRKVLESRLFALARQEKGLFGRRLLMVIAERFQEIFENVDLSQGVDNVVFDTNVFNDKLIEVSLRELMGGDSDRKTNHTAVISALKDLLGMSLNYDDKELFVGINVFKEVYLAKRSGQISFVLNDSVIDLIAKIVVKGYLLYNFDVAIKLNSEPAILFYKLIYNQDNGYRYYYTFSGFRKEFAIPEKKYKQDRDLLKVVEKAKRELDKNADVTFSYEVNLEHPDGNAKVGRRHIVGFFVTVQRLQVQVASKSQNTHPTTTMGTTVYNYLRNNLNFTHIEIINNSETLSEAVKEMGERRVIELLQKLKIPENVISKKGYVINAIKKALKNTLAKRAAGFRPMRKPENFSSTDGERPNTAALAPSTKPFDPTQETRDEEAPLLQGPLLKNVPVTVVRETVSPGGSVVRPTEEMLLERYLHMDLDKLEELAKSLPQGQWPAAFTEALKKKRAQAID